MHRATLVPLTDRSQPRQANLEVGVEFGAEICQDLNAATSREWLETNGLGSFASSTIIGLNSRRYHGLLVAALTPPTGRAVLLSKLEETLVVDGQRFDLATNRYPGAVHPDGYRFLNRFQLDPYPVLTFEVPGGELVKSVCMVHGENSTVIHFDFRPEAGRQVSAQLELRPLIAFRDYHSLTHENGSLNASYREEPGCACVAPYTGMPELFLAHDALEVEPAGYWFRSFEYDRERERGLDFQEDLFCPVVLRFQLGPGASASVIASTARRDAARARGYLEAARTRRCGIEAAGPAGEVTAEADSLIPALRLAADAFLVARGDGQTVIAGYPWFTDWGRDTMIALPGLTLVTGRHDAARGILSAFADHIDQGMLPNRFPDAGEEPEYNTVDATLWYFEAIRSFLQYTNDAGFIRERLYDKLGEILDWHERGTRYGIRVDGDGLLLSGAEGVQLTWMDAKVGDWVVTPRRGKPVEIQALWFNALRTMEGLARAFGDSDRERRCKTLANQAQRSFNSQFWNAQAHCLFDTVDGAEKDGSLRPNQILAVSLCHSMLTRERMRAVVEVVQRELLTPLGLRSLAPSDPRYVGHYGGDVSSRDGSYHQGTVWPWLMGPFLTGYMRAHGRTRAARPQVEDWLPPFREHLREAGLGQISEVTDGDPPYTPGGCFAQAWSVAELLRAVSELGAV